MSFDLSRRDWRGRLLYEIRKVRSALEAFRASSSRGFTIFLYCNISRNFSALESLRSYTRPNATTFSRSFLLPRESRDSSTAAYYRSSSVTSFPRRFMLGLPPSTLTLGHRSVETPKVRSLQGTEGAGDEGQGTSQASEALAVPIVSHGPL